MKANTTDPESRIMKTQKGYVQGYNGQTIVDAKSQIIVAADLVQDENDKHQQRPLIENYGNTLVVSQINSRWMQDTGMNKS